MPEINEAALKVIEDDLAQIAKEVADAELVIAKKRNEIMKPIFEKRRAAFNKIPNFWPQVFENHIQFGTMLEERDSDVLKHLTDLWVEHDPENPRNYKITFTFSDNDYFKNKELVKEVVFDENEGPEAKPFKIDWKEGKDLTAKGEKRKRDENDADDESFFAWFASDDASLAEMIAEELFPEAFSHYIGETLEDDEDLDSVDLDDEDSEEEEEEEEEKPKKKNAKK